MQQQQPRHERTLPEQYKPYLVQFMSFRDGRNYQKDDIFSNEELASTKMGLRNLTWILTIILFKNSIAILFENT